MQRRGTKQSPSAGAAEKKFHQWAKYEPCACCGSDSGSILDHWQGSSKKLYNGIERVYVGHWLVLPLCEDCDNVKTRGSLRAFNDTFGNWLQRWLDFIGSSPAPIPENVISAVSQELHKANRE